MKFRIWTILWVFALLASAIALFGGSGIFIFLAILILWSAHFSIERNSTASAERTSPLKLLVVPIVIVALFVFFVSAFKVAQESVSQVQCSNNMKQLALTIHTYQDAKRSLPAFAQANPKSSSRNIHSWRLWTIPFLQSSPFFSQYRKNERWDSSHNTKLVSQYGLDSLYHCPKHHATEKQCHYLAVVDELTSWHPDRGRTFSEFTDGTSNTILLIEAPDKGMPWAKPQDLSLKEAIELLTNPPLKKQFGHEIYEGFFYKASRGVHVAFADGWVTLLRVPMAREHAMALLTLDGGEDISHENIPRVNGPEVDYSKVYTLCLFIVLSLLPAMKLR